MLAAAAGIRQVIDSQMADLIRKSTLERGHDPREFVMMAFGGAGPVHAASYGADVGVREIIVPFLATVHSAYGAALSDVRFSLQHSHPLVLPVAPPTRRGDLRDDGARRCTAAHRGRCAPIPATLRALGRGALSPPGAFVARAGAVAHRRSGTCIDGRAFELEYERLFGKGAALKDAGIELVNYGVDAIGNVAKPVTAPWPRGSEVVAATTGA